MMTLVLLACLLLAGSASAGVSIQAYSGDTIPLSGYSPTSNNVYLYLTGPNLPSNGVALNDITKLAEDGGFTVVQVNGEDDSWSYNWHTNNINGRLDDGTYTIWVVNGPNDRSHLQNAEYGTISVTLGRPSISISTPPTQAVPGSLLIISEPADASVVVNGLYQGKSPLTLNTIEPGTYTVNVSKFGFTPVIATAVIRSGEQGEITAVLAPERGTLVVNTTPAGANVSLDGTLAGISPVTITNIIPGNLTVEIVKDGYVPIRQEVTIAAGTTSPLEVTLSPSSPISALPLKTPGLTAGALLSLCGAAASVAYLRSRPR
ncbi:MAG: PEGA domain-containing protein [Methanoregula sp.]|uniref:PEGA domain-containing protein n=1 Tax=Methanoregula sp. TaxID=2052170 RepID=UPI0025F56B8F|nr:PEGA domain-containing protein [Methanoregula sp.]MCK9630892.1 PEGA domain-containing protein [Methanoregula sp.]